MTYDPFEGIVFPEPKLALPVIAKEQTDEVLRRLTTKVEIRVYDDRATELGWRARVRYTVDLVEEYADDITTAIRTYLDAPPDKQAVALSDALLRLARFIESRVDLIPSWLEWLAWIIIERAVKRIVRRRIPVT